MVNVLIFSLEGSISNTEVNFFKGFDHWLENTKITIYAIGKQGAGEAKQKSMAGRVKMALRKSSYTEYKHVFFIGDGDKKEAILPMERSMQTAIEVFKKINGDEAIILKEVLFDEDKSFDGMLSKMTHPDFFPSNRKKGPNQNLFNMYAKEFGWITDGKLNIDKMKSDFNSQHSRLIEIINVLS